MLFYVSELLVGSDSLSLSAEGMFGLVGVNVRFVRRKIKAYHVSEFRTSAIIQVS
jgi:hypothetical protein